MKQPMSEFFGKPKDILKNIALLLLLLLVIVYALVQILPSVTDRVKTQTALPVSMNDETAVMGYTFRSETVLTTDGGGTLVPAVRDGERVSVDQTIAYVYGSEAAADQQTELTAIDRRIEVLENSIDNGSLFAADLERIDKDTLTSLDTLYADMANGRLDNLVSTEKDFLTGINKHESVVSDGGTLVKELAELRSERSALAARISADSYAIRANTSGYYYSEADGCESIFLPSLTDTLTVESFRKLVSGANASVPAGCCGKLVTDFAWYFVCVTTKEAAAWCDVGSYCTLRFPMEADATIKLELLRVARAADEDAALLVFRGNTAPENFSFRRTEEAYIVREKYAGLAVPKDAIRMVDGYKGVYILDGDIVRFRYIEEEFERDEYCIVKESLPTLWFRPDGTQLSEEEIKELVSAAGTPEEAQRKEEEKKQYTRLYPLSLYDSVIVSGKKLFDGKILA